MVVPLLDFMNTGIKNTELYQKNTKEIYAADTGIQNALWKIKYDPMIIYDRQNNNYGKTYTYPAFTADNNSVVISITSIWLLSGIVNMTNGDYPHSTWVGMTMGGQASPSASPNQPGTFTMTFTYDQSGNKRIDQMGVWLPLGFTYVDGSSSTSVFPSNIITSSDPAKAFLLGGSSLVWDVQPNFSFQHLNPPTATHKFYYLPGNRTPTGAAAWVKSQSNDIGYQWDNALWWYNITSTATDTSNSKTTTIKATVVNNSGATPGLTVVTYEISPS